MVGNRLLLITEYFWPDEASTGRFLGQLIDQIQVERPTWKITVLTSDRLYRTSETRPLSYEQYRGNVRIIRIHSWRSGQDGLFRRMWSDLLFSVGAMTGACRLQYDCLMVVTNPPIMPLLLSMYSRWRRKPLLYLIHDLYPDVAVALKRWSDDKMYVRVLRFWQSKALRASERIIVLGRCMRDYLIEQYRVNAESIRVFGNWYTLNAAEPHANRHCENPKTFDVVYSGNLGGFQDFDTLLDAAELLLSHRAIRFQFIGDGERKAYIQGEITRRGLSNVILRGFLSEEEYSKLLAHVSLGVVSLEPQMEGLGVPSKTYNLLAIGIPILAVLGERSEVARIIQEAGCGYRVNHGDARRVSEIILELCYNPTLRMQMSERAQSYAVNNASLPMIAKQYIAMLDEYLAASSAAVGH